MKPSFSIQASTLPASIALLALLGLIFALYAQALGGRLLFDDMANLEDLAYVFADGQFHAEAARRFVLGGDAGPLGRPLSLLTFLLDGSGWPIDVAALLYTNSLLHVLNSSLLAGMLFALGRALGWSAARAAWVAVASTALWALSPLIASASLMPIQRMTILSSTFMLAGMWGYLAARRSLEHTPLRAMLLMGLSIGVGGILGVFSKEQAALLPGFILALELFLLPKPHFNPAFTRAPKLWQAFRWLVLGLPLLLIVGYLAKNALQHESIYAMRPFGMFDRLASELLILWDYVRLSLVPRPADFSPFHDGVPLSNFSEKLPWVALAGWLGLMGLAVWLRHRFPWLLFALAWFWVAHLLESTVLPLELYFEHRNYLAFVGMWFALAAVLVDWAVRTKSVPLAAAGFSTYLGVLAFMLWQVTSLYGNPRLAAEIWFMDFPQSERSAQFLAQAYALENDLPTALHVLDKAAERSQMPNGLRLQGFQLACSIGVESAEQLTQRIARVRASLPLDENLQTLPATLNQLRHILQKQDCKGVLTTDLVAQVVEDALKNPRFASDKRNLANVEIIIAAVFLDQKQLEATLEHLDRALSNRPDLDTLELALSVMNSGGLFNEGLKLIDRHSKKLVSSPLRKTYDGNALSALRAGQVSLIEAEKTGEKS